MNILSAVQLPEVQHFYKGYSRLMCSLSKSFKPTMIFPPDCGFYVKSGTLSSMH